MSDIVLDTTKIATDTIDYVATDRAGLTATSTRTVMVEALSPPLVPDYNASTTIPTITGGSAGATSSPTVEEASSSAPPAH